MKKSTRQIVKAALGADDTVRPDQVDAVLSLLNERPPMLEANRPLPLLITQAEAARLLCVSRFTIYRLVQAGELKRVMVRGVRRYRREDVERLARDGGGHPSA